MNEKTFRLAPSKKFRKLVFDIYGGLNQAAEAWGVEYGSLQRFFETDGNLSSTTVATLVQRTGLPYEDLFEHEEVRG